ncbi:MAG: hypothetical protein E7328_01130 [Clostridiales bacterium]|nr:hypothetical protein [Clostridiales bacterium]
MKRENYVTLVLATIGAVLFSLGMCMCLIPEWNAFQQGVILGIVGIVTLLITLLVRRKMQGKGMFSFDKRTAVSVALLILGVLTFGTGLCMTMVFEGMMIWGIIVGLIGMLMLLSLIPLYKRLK